MSLEKIKERATIDSEKKEEEVIEDVKPADEKPKEETPKEGEPAPVENETPRERALRQEVTRLKKERREARRLIPVEKTKADDDEADQQPVTKSEATLYNAFQQEALDDFLDEHPEYGENDETWSAFMAEFEDRLPMVEWAEKKKIPLTKKLIRERLKSIHRALGSDITRAKEEGKKELLKTQSAAQIAAAGSARGVRHDIEGKAPRKRILPKKQSGFSSWVK